MCWQSLKFRLPPALYVDKRLNLVAQARDRIHPAHAVRGLFHCRLFALVLKK